MPRLLAAAAATRLSSVDTLLSEQLGDLGRLQQLTVAGCVRALAGRGAEVLGMAATVWLVVFL